MWGHQQLSQCAGPLGNLWGHPEFRTKAAAQGQLPALPPARQRNSHGIIKVGRDSHDHQVQPSTPATPKPSPSARSGRLLNSSTSLGVLLQCLTSQTVNVFFIISTLSLPLSPLGHFLGFTHCGHGRRDQPPPTTASLREVCHYCIAFVGYVKY